MEKNVYATNSLAMIKAPKSNAGKDPAPTKTVSKPKGDLRSGK